MYQTKTKKFVAGLIGASLALSLAFAVTVKADTVSDLTAQIASLLATITGLQAQLSTIQGTPSMSTGFTFLTDLQVGSKGTDVMNLQKVLNMSADTQVASGASAGAPGYETSTFGPATKAAVMKFQAKKGITPVLGYVGPKTRAVLNAMSTVVVNPGNPNNPAPTPGTGLTVSSPVQPATTIAPNGASRVPFTKITLTAGNDGDVTVNSLTIQRTGLAQDAAFASIVLIDEQGLQIGTSKTFNSNHQTTLGDPFVIPRGTSRTLTVAGNMPTSGSSYSGQVATLTVVGVNTSATVTGSLPITGAAQTMNSSLTLGTATLYSSQYDPASNLNKSIGDTGVKFSGIKVTAGSAEDVTLWSVRWNQTGSAGASDIANLVTVLDGTSYPTIVSADGKYYTTLFPNGIAIQKGFSKEFYIQGDIVGSGSANRTVEFDLYNASDLYLSGNTYNFGVTATPNSTGTLTSTSRSKFTTSTPFYGGSIVTINAGTVTTVSKSTTAGAASNIAINVPNQVLGAFDTNIKGEPISVQSMVFHLSSNSSATTKVITSVSLVDKNGSVVAGPKDAAGVNAADGAAGAAGDQTVTFTDTVTFPVGPGTYTLVGKLPGGATGYTNGSTVIASTTPSGWGTVRGQITGNTLTLTNALFGMNTMTVRTANLAVAASNNPSAQIVVAGSQGFTFTNLQFDATQSGEDVRVTTIPLTLTYTGGAGTDVSSCGLYDGATLLTTGSNIVNPDTTASAAPYTFTLDQSLVISKGTVKTISVKCNVSGAATAFVGHWDMTSAQVTALTVTGVTSTGSVTATGSATGLAMTVGSATLAATGDTSGTSYKVASAGTSGVTTAAFRLKATNDNVDLQRIVLKLTNTASSSSSDVTQVHIFDGSTEVGTAVFTGGNSFATSTLNTPVHLLRDTDKVLTVKADLANIGTSQAVTMSGHLINIDIDTNDTAGTYGTGVGSGVRVNSTGSTSIASTGIRVFKSYPSFAQDTITASGLGANLPLLRFKVTADTKGSVNIAKFLLSLSTSSVTISGVNIFAFTDSGYSQPLSGVNSGGQLMSTAVSTGAGGSSYGAIAIYPQTVAGATTTIQVASGNTMYFEVRASTVTTSGTSYNVVTTLKGDTGYPLVSNTYFMSTVAGSDAGSNSALNSLIWSPNSTTTPSVNDVDWTNGYALPGLPSNGISQSRSN
ncbi:MAG: peptidoglycan-binding domain-containing protein [Patescibacteria group bacterium]